MKHVLVFGPMGCGKTLNKDLLAKAFDCPVIHDGVGIREFKHLTLDAQDKALFITNEEPAESDHAAARRADILSFDTAMRIATELVLGPWQSAGEKPQTAEGTELAVRMRGVKDGESAFVEVNGFFLNAYGLYYDDGCECFGDGENVEERERHENCGCPHTGFYFVDPEGGEEAEYQQFRCVEWCKR